MTTWHEYMHRRIKGGEKKMPWFLHDKIRCYEYLADIGIPTVEVLRTFDSPANIDLDGLPDEFVLKPTRLSSTKGVLVLSRTAESQWYDSMRRRSLTADAIRAEQTSLFENSPKGNSIIIEEKLIDAGGHEIPRDFKSYGFRGLVALTTLIDRNTRPTTVSWFDEAMLPIEDDRIEANSKYIHQVTQPTPEGGWGLIRVAAELSAKLPTPFSRIDMYLTPRGPVVGEITLTPGGFYHGQHYKLNDEHQVRMGLMWEQAAMDVELESKAKTRPE